MAELTIRPDEIRDALASFVQSYEPDSAAREEVGVVAEAGDGIARVEGLPSAMYNELLEFPGGIRGLALNLDERVIGVVILGDFTKIDEGQQVRRTGEILSVPVGDGFLGRVVDPLGVPLDGQGDIETTELRPLETQAPSVVQRSKVNEPLQTGIKAIDAITPIGRGQRELIIGDRQTGKTAIAIDSIINQRENWESGDPARQVKCIYVAVGQKGSTTAQVKQSLEDAGAMKYTTIVASPASDPSGYKYIAPYTGSAIGQHWMYQGQSVLIIFDDLSKQAEAYRGDRGALLPDGHVDAAHLPRRIAGVPVLLLVDDRVDGDRGLTGLPVADDQLTLTAADRRHRVDGLDASLQRLGHRLPVDDRRRLELQLALLSGALDRAEAVQRRAERADDAAEEAVAHGHRQHLAGPPDPLAFLDLTKLTEDDDADLADVQVQRDAAGTVLELQ